MGNAILGIDGEALDGEYKLLGSSVHNLIDRQQLTSRQCFEFLLDQAASSQRMYGYGIGYDVAHWIRDLTHSQKMALAKTGCCYTELGLRFYRVSYRPNVYFRVDRLKGIPTSKGGKETIQSALVVDLMRWHRKPFSEVADDWGLGDEETRKTVRCYKEARPEFTSGILPAVERYNANECDMIAELGEGMQDFLRQMNLPVSYPLSIGAVAGLLAHRNQVAKYRSEPEDGLAEIMARAFHGGRMQVCRFGSFESVRHYDIRSAYGWAMSQLPDLRGYWTETSGRVGWSTWGLHEVTWDIDELRYPVMPFPHRDANGYIHYPPRGRGWYWSPLVKAAMKHYPYGSIQVGRSSSYTPMGDVKPFGYMADLQAMREALGDDPAAGMLKLLMVATWGRLCSSYGKKRDRNREGKGNTTGMVDWAGMTTALVQARILDAIMETGQASFISCCVDGFFTTGGPNLDTGSQLGDWSMEDVDELFLIRPSFYWARKGEYLDCKTSGIATNSETLDTVREEWGRRTWKGAVAASQRHCRGLLQCANEGDFSRLGEFEDVRQVFSLNPGMGKYGHTCPSVMVNNGQWERWLPYWPPHASWAAESQPFQSRKSRSIPEEISGEALEETSEG